MSEVAVDFGTSNTVLARFNETTQRAETIPVPEISRELRYRLAPDAPEQSVWVIPSLIYFGQTETLIGNQVLERGLADHPDTLRWMKRAIAQGSTRRRRTAQGFKSPDEAGLEFLRLALNYASNQISFEEDTFTFTLPVEAFETFQDWIWHVAESLGIRKLRTLDEPTAAVFGYREAIRHDERFLVFDFGGGTLDISAVRLDLSAESDRKAIQLGQAGCELGGMDIDRWIADDFCRRHQISSADRRELENVILREAEALKIALSEAEQAEMSVLNPGAARLYQTAYTRQCPACERGRRRTDSDPSSGCLGCLLQAGNFQTQVRQTLDRALENAAVKAALRRGEIAAAMATGGTSLMPQVRALLQEYFAERAVLDHPFDCVVRGACRGLVMPILQHDYAIESYNRHRRQYEFQELFTIGTPYPTAPQEVVRLWANGSSEGQTRLGLVIYEVSRMRRPVAMGSIVDEHGRFRQSTRVVTEFQHIALNADNPTFIVADPPINLQRDKRRFLCTFEVDGNRRLLVTVLDQLTGREVLKQHPVVRL